MTWSVLGWIVPLVFLALPDCALDKSGKPGPPVPEPPPPPKGWAIFCDIEDPSEPRKCLTLQPQIEGIPIANAAVALTTREANAVGFDFSPEAGQALGCPGQPVAITFRGGAFPRGWVHCLPNAPDKIGPQSEFQNTDEVCRLACKQLLLPNDPDEFCDKDQHARASTNFPPSGEGLGPYEGVCTKIEGMPEGVLDPAFDTDANPDPRRIPAPAPWDSVSVSDGVTRTGPELNGLRRDALSSELWDKGAATLAVIEGDNGYVEFTADDTTQDRACGLSSGAAPDTDPSLDGIGFAVRLEGQGNLIIHESGAAFPTFKQYMMGDRVRIKFTDNFDGTATIAYHLIAAGTKNEGDPLRTTPGAAYPLRVDASLLTHLATLTDVRLVHIKTVWP